MIQFFKKYRSYLDHSFTQEEINDIVYYLEKEWYLQILKEFGIEAILVLIEYHKSIEDYIVCKNIVDAIKNSNQYFGTNYPTSMNEDEVLS